MVTISNGFNKFHLAVAAAEINRRGILSQFMTGAYPTRTVHRLVSALGLISSNKLRRLFDRGEVLTEAIVYPLWFAEFVYQFGMTIERFKLFETFGKVLNIISFKFYGVQARRCIKKAPPHTKIYHYRAGFGGQSVKIAKERGMIALCDHSIAHPAVLEHLINQQGQLPPERTQSPMNSMWSYILKDINQSDAVLVNSNFVKDTFLHQGWDPKLIHTIYLGVDDQFLKCISHNVKKDNDPSGALRLLFAGTFERRKGAESLIAALEKANDCSWQLEIAGGVNTEIIRQNASFFKNSHVKCLGVLSRSELAQRMSGTEVFVFPSLAEGSARVVFEALAAGCYIITTPNSGSIVKDGVHGRLIPPGDSEAIAAAIRNAFENRDLIQSIGEQNARLIRTKYRQVRYGDRLVELYRHLLEADTQK